MAKTIVSNVVLFLGNGFDLDLGLPTKYSDFASETNIEWLELTKNFEQLYSQLYKEETINASLLTQLIEVSRNDYWFDVEKEIYKYVLNHKRPTPELIGLVRNQYERFKYYFSNYLNRIISSTIINPQSLANVLFNRLVKSNICSTICTFNYTDCFDLCSCHKRDGLKYMPIHGSLKNNNIILGCRAPHNQIEYAFDFLSKSTEVPSNLLQISTNYTIANEVIVFGHSLNLMDSCYFSELFDANNNNSDKILTIICKNTESERLIVENINEWSNFSETHIDCDVQFIHTDGWYKNEEQENKAFKDLCNRLKI